MTEKLPDPNKRTTYVEREDGILDIWDNAYPAYRDSGMLIIQHDLDHQTTLTYAFYSPGRWISVYQDWKIPSKGTLAPPGSPFSME